MRTTDKDLIRSIMSNRHVYRHISDDGSPSADEFEPPMDDRIFYLLVCDLQDRPAGVFMLHPHNTVCYEVHTCMTPAAWGYAARSGAIAGCKWMFENTPCERIITNVPTYNRLAERFAIDCGMTKYGVNPKSIMKNGTLHDQSLYGIGKGDWLCRQQSH